MPKKLIANLEWVLSFLLMGATIYQSLVGSRLFFVATGIFALETIIYVLSLFKGKPLKAASIIQFLQSPFVMVVLLIAVFLDGQYSYSILMIVSSSIYILFKAGATIYYLFDYKREDDYISYAKFYNASISLIYVINLLLVMILKNFSNEQNMMVLLVILVVLNAISTFGVSYLASAFLITSLSEKILNFKEKIKAVTRVFIKHQLGFIISEFFTLVAMGVSFFNVRSSPFFVFLGIFYSLIFTDKLIAYLWNKRLEKDEKDEVSLSRKKHGILLFNSVFFLAAGNILSISSLLLSVLKASSQMPIWFFVGFMFPFSTLGIVFTIINRRSSRDIRNPYLEVRFDQSLITSLFSLLAGLSYFIRYIPNEDISRFIWLSLWLGALVLITVALIISFVHAIKGLAGKRRIKKVEE
ncbi:MAG: hypothetical protein K5694_05010 [Bacilli bacterium]|nr:hypothetical protein [Bacilli bacterium]